ncbi:UPF0489 family protein [Paenibacillus xylanilyticus]|nr:UPF0489 family protein [Paenibacillus xylanilyticus]
MGYEWEKDINWVVHTKDNKMFIMRDHNWSFAAWEIARLNKQIKSKSLVIHVDSHLDDVADGVRVKNLKTANTKDEIIEVARSYDRSLGEVSPSSIMHIDNFIWGSLARGTIEEVIYVSRDTQDVNTLESMRASEDVESLYYLSELPSDCNYLTTRFTSIDSFLSHFSESFFKEYVSNRSVILDLDLDVFNNSDSKSDLFPDDKVREYITRLFQLYPWDLITIAISPDFCGGINEAEHLFSIAREIMEIDLNTMHKLV